MFYQSNLQSDRHQILSQINVADNGISYIIKLNQVFLTQVSSTIKFK
jgi:hypothetical protein